MAGTVGNEFNARSYQIELAKTSVKENIIVYLPTGSGKTYIAVLVIKELGSALELPYSSGGKRTIFIVNTKALSDQQSKYLNKHTGYVCKGYTGDLNIEKWKAKEWTCELEKVQVLVMTAQIFLDMLTHGFIALNRVNLLIFDECHHAVSKHPMRLIMQQFDSCPQYMQPRVLGMSASLLNSNIDFEKLEATLRDLQCTFHAQIRTVDPNLVASFSTNPQESIVLYESVDKKSSIIKETSNIVYHTVTSLNHVFLPSKSWSQHNSLAFQPDTIGTKLKRVFLDVTDDIIELGVFGGSRCVLFHIQELENLKVSQPSEDAVNAFEYAITQFIKIQKLLSLELVDEPSPLNFFEKHSSPKFMELASILKNFYTETEGDSNFCCIIFVRRRFIAKTLCSILQELIKYDPSYSFLKPDYVIGSNADAFKKIRESTTPASWAKEALNRFRVGTTNCLVATDVIDEGVDVPSCTLVIRFQAPYDFRAYIQSKGRARHATSKFIILAEAKENYERKYHQNFVKLERHLKKELRHATSYQTGPTQEEIENTLYDDYSLEPFIIMRNNGYRSMITEYNAVSIINTYCSSLLKSTQASSSAPIWIKKNVRTSEGTRYKVDLTLPPGCPLKEFSSDEMLFVETAKKSVAYKACIALYKVGEIDDKLMPRKGNKVDGLASDLYSSFENAESTSNHLAGTNGMKRKHKIVDSTLSNDLEELPMIHNPNNDAKMKKKNRIKKTKIKKRMKLKRLRQLKMKKKLQLNKKKMELSLTS